MNFEHTEDRRMLADSLNRFIAEQYAFEARDRIAKSQHGFSKDIFQKFAELGVIGALFSEADGGFGGGGLDIAVVFEALGRGLVVEPLLGAVMVGEAISVAGSDAQKEKLGDIINGVTVAGLAHDEPDAHYELARVQTRAERSGDGWVLSGAKAVVPQGEQAELHPLLDRGRPGRGLGVATWRQVELGPGAPDHEEEDGEQQGHGGGQPRPQPGRRRRAGHEHRAHPRPRTTDEAT